MSGNIKLESKRVTDERVPKQDIKDENGYYKIRLGALNTYNENGIFYKLDSIKRLLSNDGIFKSRLDEGILRSEFQHPSFEGMNQQQLISRLFKIDMDRVCGHLKAVEFTNTGRTEDGWKGYPIYIVTGWVKPSGPYGKYLEEALDNPDENVSFSIRSAVREYSVGAMRVRDVVDISTYDFVHEPGVRKSSQFDAGSMEERVIDGCEICVGDSCIPKLKKMVKEGVESSSELNKIISELENRMDIKPSIMRW